MSYYDELDHEIDKEMGWTKGRKYNLKRGPDYWAAILKTAKASSPFFRILGRAVRGIAKVVFFPIISPLGYSRRFNAMGDVIVVKRSIFWRVVDGILTRALLTPLILAVFLIAMVYASTHPRTVRAVANPDSYGIYFKRVSLVTVDNQALAAWYLPPISADEVAFDPEGVLTQKWPAVVLCHGLGASQDQYLPLAKQLHDAGFAVLMLDMRGQGESDPAAVTYGLRERFDVLAAVKMLRETQYVDESKVCVVGHDIGATAALQAAALDSSITAVVADGLWLKFEDRARDIFSRPPAGAGAWAANGGRLPTQWLAPLYTLAFEIAIRDRLEQLNPEAVVRSIHTQPALFIARQGEEYAPVQ
ncbi:MAG TPA: alpha/beta fold hydrolase, partial [Phycisphaerae bacterium]|nr:alpha/beta fold hydrolase [Phycisphaerae bacterium]